MPKLPSEGGNRPATQSRTNSNSEAPASQTGQVPPVRYRASKACRRCNEQRVKCDASERGTPCTRCEQRQVPDCRLIESRRGIYVRKPRRKTLDSSTDQAENTNQKKKSSSVDAMNPIRNHENDNCHAPAAMDGVITHENANIQPQTSAAALSTLAWLSSSEHNHNGHNRLKDSQIESHSQQQQDTTGQQGPPPRSSVSVDVAANSSPNAIRADHRASIDDTGYHRPRTLNNGTEAERQHALPTPGTGLAENDTPSGNTEVSNSSSYREISWATMFDHLLEGQRRGEDVVDKCSITYLGESFPLSIVLKDLKGGRGKTQLHHPGPPCPASEETTEPQSLHHPPYMRPEDIAFLEAKNAFESPERGTLDALLGVFLNRVFPIYPIVDRQEFLQQLNSKRIPWVLLHALCFISATFCPPNILHRAGFESRRQARWFYYSKAKALFDVGYEGNKLVLLQVSILMSFWGGGPNNYWNFYSWISTGVTIAETLGCHRSMAGTNIKPRDRSLLKRLWWILVLRDTSCAALVGRPFRVNLDHCDIDALTIQDFQHDAASPDFATSPYAHLFGLYQIHATKLTLVLRHIIKAQFHPTRDNRSLSSWALRDMLTEWRSELPPALEWTERTTKYTNILTSSLSISYNHHMILAHLGSSQQSAQATPPTSFADRPSPEEISRDAAQQISSTACAVAMRSEILLAPHELFHGIFIAAVIFYLQSKSANPMNAQLGLSGLTNCQMVLHESYESWDPSPWITQLFDKVLGTVPPAHTSTSEEQNIVHNTSGYADNAAAFGAHDVDGLFSTEYDMWVNHPVLGNLLDVPMSNNMLPMTPNFGDKSGHTPWFDAWAQIGGS